MDYVLYGSDLFGGTTHFFVRAIKDNYVSYSYKYLLPSDCNTSLAFWLGIEACTPEDFAYSNVTT